MGHDRIAASNLIREQSEEKLRAGLKEAMSRLATSVSVVTTWIDGRPWGTTVSSCCSLSMYPPLVLACLANTAVSIRAILEQGCFGLNILAIEQLELARKTALQSKPKFIDELVADTGDSIGTPMIKGSLASIHCELYNALVVGDHTIVIGEVGEVIVGKLRDPLIYFDRQFLDLDLTRQRALRPEGEAAGGDETPG
jgi:flavin reductase ActVB